ncbi:HNH endonuclease [Streptomyces sp. DH12]|uniref:HNH endonuclease n=1 Tax=Streptomyces sp. DH12 TaxID=2857010 RepID=UPI0034D5CA05
MRPPEPPRGPSHRDVLRRWEELEWWTCTYCDRDFGPSVVAEVDHVRPLAHGGLHEWGNLVPACRDCNRAKSDSDVVSWLAAHLRWL